MTHLTDQHFLSAIDATWAPQSQIVQDNWCIRVGAGGGQRVSAATALHADADIAVMSAAQRQLGQTPLVMVRGGEDALDARLAEAEFVKHDPVQVLCIDPKAWPRAQDDAFKTTRNEHPLAIQEEIWAQDGIGPERLAVMARVDVPKCYLLGRDGDTPAGVAFVAVDGRVAMLHAFYVSKNAQGKGVGSRMMRDAADWAIAQGATALAVLVRDATPQARALYVKRGMEQVTRYHYRVLETRSET